MKVGDRIWRLSFNHRGRDWEEREIVGETRISWLVTTVGGKADDWNVEKVAKKALADGGSGLWVCSREEAPRRDWTSDNAYRIGERVGRCEDYDTLKAIEALIATYDANRQLKR